MSKNFKVQVEFSPLNDDKLIKALENLAIAQDKLRKANHNLQISAERVNQAQIRTKILLDRATTAAEKNRLAVEKLKVQKKTLQARLDKANLALTRYRNGLKRTTRTGALATRNNRLLSNSFATIRSTLLLASFGVGLVSSSFIRLASLAGEQKRVEDQLAVALGRTSQALLDQASALQQTTGFGDEAIIGAQAQLAAFTDNEEQIKKLTVATLDFATAQGMSLNEAAKLLGKSIGSSTNALSRYGVTVNGAVGSTERLDSAVAGISKLFGDQASARLLSFNGQLELAAGNIGDVGEDIGAELVPALTKALQNFNAMAKFVQENNRAFHALNAGLKLGIVALSMYFFRLRQVSAILLFIPKQIGKFLGAIKSSPGIFKQSGTALALFSQRLGQIPIGFRKFTTIAKDVGTQVKLLSSRLEFTGLKAILASAGVGALTAQFTSLFDSIKKALGITEDNSKADDENAKKKKELNKQLARLLELQGKVNDVMDKSAQKSFILAANTEVEETRRKALVKTLTDFNKQSGMDIELGEIKNLQDLQNIISADQMVLKTDEQRQKAKELAAELFNLNMIQETGSISNAKATQLRISALSQLAGSFAQLNEGSKSASLISLRLQQIEAVASAYNAQNRYLEMKPPRPVLGKLALAQGLANAALIEKQASKARAAATGADFVTQGFTRMTVGEEGAERVQVTPLGMNSRAAAGGMRDITVNINGNVAGTNEFVRDVLIPSIEDTIDRNLA